MKQLRRWKVTSSLAPSRHFSGNKTSFKILVLLTLESRVFLHLLFYKKHTHMLFTLFGIADYYVQQNIEGIANSGNWHNGTYALLTFHGRVS